MSFDLWAGSAKWGWGNRVGLPQPRIYLYPRLEARSRFGYCSERDGQCDVPPVNKADSLPER